MKKIEKGQALITLLFFAIIGVTMASASTVMIVVNSISESKFQQGLVAYDIAKSGAENGLIRLLRDPTYPGENNLPVGQGTVSITITGSGTTINPYIITSTGILGNFTRKVQIKATYINNLLTVISQSEIF